MSHIAIISDAEHKALTSLSVGLLDAMRRGARLSLPPEVLGALLDWAELSEVQKREPVVTELVERINAGAQSLAGSMASTNRAERRKRRSA